jgi:hypothetical protein
VISGHFVEDVILIILVMFFSTVWIIIIYDGYGKLATKYNKLVALVLTCVKVFILVTIMITANYFINDLRF